MNSSLVFTNITKEWKFSLAHPGSNSWHSWDSSSNPYLPIDVFLIIKVIFNTSNTSKNKILVWDLISYSKIKLTPKQISRYAAVGQPWLLRGTWPSRRQCFMGPEHQKMSKDNSTLPAAENIWMSLSKKWHEELLSHDLWRPCHTVQSNIHYTFLFEDL